MHCFSLYGIRGVAAHPLGISASKLGDTAALCVCLAIGHLSILLKFKRQQGEMRTESENATSPLGVGFAQ